MISLDIIMTPSRLHNVFKCFNKQTYQIQFISSLNVGFQYSWSETFVYLGGQDHVPLPEGDLEEQVDVSLVTGSVRKMGVNKQDGGGVSSALVARNENTQVVAATPKNAGATLSHRLINDTLVPLTMLKMCIHI